MFPRWLGLLIVGLILILAGVFLAPLLPGAIGTFGYYVLLIIGGAAVVWGLIVLVLGHTRGGPREPHV